MAAKWSDPWEGDRVARWIQQAATLDAQLAPVADELFAATRLASGEAVLDVGCGTGSTTRRAAAAAGVTGRVTGLDISPEMLQAAAQAPVVAGAAPVEWLQADAVQWSPPPGRYDVVVSRFGVMFFSEPVRAFANLAAATRPDGRLAIATWARRGESALFELPLAAALSALGREASELPDDDGPFSLPDHDVIATVLEPAGWIDIRAETHHLDLPFGGGLDPAAAAAAALDFGPTRVVTANLDVTSRQRVADAITETLADHVDERGHVVLAGTVLITTARR